MKTIEERAKAVGTLSQFRSDYPYDKKSVEFGYMTGATEQKVIDDAELLKLKSSYEREAQIKYDDEANYKQGYQNAIENAYQWIKERIDIPYEGEFVDDIPVASDYIKWCEKRLEYAKAIADAFKQAMEEQNDYVE